MRFAESSLAARCLLIAVAHSICGCLDMDGRNAVVPVAIYEKTGQAFVMIVREDETDGRTTWSQGSGVAVEGNGLHYIYTAKHILFDKANGNALPKRLYATTLQGESFDIDLLNIETPQSNHDAVRIELSSPICRELHLSNRSPRYGERLFFFGDAKGVGVMCAEIGTVVAVGPLEFEHTADIIIGMSGGPVVDADGRLVGLCEKGRIATAHKNGVEIKSDSRYLKVRKFAVPLHNVEWQTFKPK